MGAIYTVMSLKLKEQQNILSLLHIDTCCSSRGLEVVVVVVVAPDITVSITIMKIKKDHSTTRYRCSRILMTTL
jgi:hypothetical protein